MARQNIKHQTSQPTFDGKNNRLPIFGLLSPLELLKSYEIMISSPAGKPEEIDPATWKNNGDSQGQTVKLLVWGHGAECLGAESVVSTHDTH